MSGEVMEPTPENLAMIQNLFEVVLRTSSEDERRDVEGQLKTFNGYPGYPTCLMELVGSEDLELPVRQQAAIQFKNYITQFFPVDPDAPEDVVLVPEERTSIKASIMDLILLVGGQRRLLNPLADAVSIMAQLEFPDEWPELTEQLAVAFQEPRSMGALFAAFETANSSFRWFRGEEESDFTNVPLKKIVDDLAGPMMHAWSLAEGEAKEILARVGDKAASDVDSAALEELELALHCLRAGARVFFSLSSVLLPAAFEENLDAWMNYHHELLLLPVPRALASERSDKPQIMERLKAALLANLSLYAEKHDTEFERFYGGMLEVVWGVLRDLPETAGGEEAALAPRYDGVVVEGLRFLWKGLFGLHRKAFETREAVEALIKDVVLPNLRLRPADSELVMMSPLEFARRELEGAEDTGRRRMATNVMHALMTNFSDELAGVARDTALGAAEALQASFQEDPDERWADAEAGIALVWAAAAASTVPGEGVVAVNDSVPLGEFMGSTIVPELQAGVASGDLVDRELLRIGCLRFVMAFRTQFSSEDFAELVPLVAAYVSADSPAIVTFAAAALERMLAVREGKRGGGPRPLRVPAETVAEVYHKAVESLLRVVADGEAEDEFAVRCLLRLIAVGRARVLDVVADVTATVAAAIGRAAANPSNPNYNHALFEVTAVTSVAGAAAADDPVGFLSAIEDQFLPVFVDILERNVEEFVPYVLQIMGELLHLRVVRGGGHGGSAPPAAYVPVFPRLLDADLWFDASTGRPLAGNVPALTSLLRSFLHLAADWVVAQGKLTDILEVFDALLKRASTDEDGTRLAEAVVRYVPLEALGSMLPVIFQVSVARLRKTGKTRSADQACRVLLTAAAQHGGRVLLDALEEAEEGSALPTVRDLLTGDNCNCISNAANRRNAAIGLARLATDSDSAIVLLEDSPDLWRSVVTTVALLLEGQVDMGAAAETVEERSTKMLEEALGPKAESSYSADISHLAYVSVGRPQYLFRDLNPHPGAFLAERLASMSLPDGAPSVHSLISDADPDTRHAVEAYTDIAKVSIPS